MQGFYKVLAIARTISLLHMANTDDPLLFRDGSDHFCFCFKGFIGTILISHILLSLLRNSNLKKTMTYLASMASEGIKKMVRWSCSSTK